MQLQRTVLVIQDKNFCKTDDATRVAVRMTQHARSSSNSPSRKFDSASYTLITLQQTQLCLVNLPCPRKDPAQLSSHDGCLTQPHGVSQGRLITQLTNYTTICYFIIDANKKNIKEQLSTILFQHLTLLKLMVL